MKSHNAWYSRPLQGKETKKGKKKKKTPETSLRGYISVDPLGQLERV